MGCRLIEVEVHILFYNYFGTFFHCPLNRRWRLLSTFKIGGCLVAVQLYCKVVADPDPQIRGGGGGGVIQTLRLVWGDWGLSQKKKFFSPLDLSLV